MIDNTIKVITPNIIASSDNSFCLSIRNDGENMTLNAIKRPGNDKYVITSKNGSIPDIELDEQTIDLLIEARQKTRLAKDIIFRCRNDKKVDNAILNDAAALLSVIEKTTYPVNMRIADLLCVIAKYDEKMGKYVVSQN